MKYIITLLVGAVLVLSLLSSFDSGPLRTGSTDFNVLGTSGTSGTVNVTSTAKSLLSTNTGRVYASLCNDGTEKVYLHFDSSTSSNVATSSGYTLGSGLCYEIDADNLWITQVWAITDTTTAQVITTIEK